ncbi:MAG: hypothetical protein QM753_20235 [Thermomicrobiales bacterium]
MSSRDGSGQSGNKRRAAKADPYSSPTQAAYDIDPAEIDRYLSGQPQRAASQRATRPTPSSTHTTPDQLDRLRRLVESDDATPFTPARQTTAYREPTSSSSARRTPSSSYDNVYYEDDYVYDPQGSTDYLDDYPGQWEEEGDPAVANGSQRGTRAKPSLPRVTIPRSVTNAAILADRTALTFIGLGIVSLIGMAVLVSNRINTLPAQIGTHVSASGVLEDFASRDAIWRVPLLALMLTLMNVVISVFAARFDRFASRLVLAAGLVVQFLAWVALIRIL